MNETHKMLVDMYAGRELSAEMEDELLNAATANRELADDMRSMRVTMDALNNESAPEFTEESYQRILMKVYARGVDIQKQTPDPIYLQYHLPIQG